MKLNKYLIFTFLFLPLFLSSKGIYKGVISENNLHLGDRGLIFPLIFFFGLYCLVVIFFKMCFGLKIKINNSLIILIAFLIVYTFVIALLGFIREYKLIIFLRYFQFISFSLGLVIFYYLFIIKKLQLKKYFSYVFYFFILIIFVHYISSFREIGIVSSIKSISPNIFFFGIYQSRVYYPYLVVCIFFFSINYIKNNVHIILGILLMGVYIFSLQVRGALISYIAYVFLYFLIKVKYKILSASLFSILILIFYPKLDDLSSDNLGRFADTSKFGSFNGRIDIWKKDLVPDSPINIFFGDFFYDADGISSHNQYINFNVYGGIVLLIILALIILYFSKLLLIALKRKNPSDIFVLSMFFVPIIVDLNLNVPLNNINSSIIYTFIWSAIIYHIKLGGSDEKVNKI